MSCESSSDSKSSGRLGAGLAAYLVLGVCFGFTLTRSEVLSWFRIQEMFRFQSPRMYLIIASAVAVAAASVALIKRFRVRTLSGEAIELPAPGMRRGFRYPIGGLIFGIGWALTGACPGPLFALVGGGVSVMLAAVCAALGGTWLYGLLRPRLPH